MQHEILKIGASALRYPAKPVENIDKKIHKLVKVMFEVQNKAKGYGLAANQIGYTKRIFTFGDKVVINPMLVEMSKGVISREACLSIPGKWFDVQRWNKVTLVGLNLDGEEVTYEETEVLAHVFQHEIDHLNGILIPDRLGQNI